MRRGFDRQQRLDCTPVAKVRLNHHCRDESIPLLVTLQHIYSQPALREDILRRVGQDVNRHSSRKRGRKGLDYWPILVLAAVRLGCNFDYDRLQALAEQHRALREIMGIGNWDENTRFDWRRIHDNLLLIRPETLEHIHHLVVAEGHRWVPHAVETVRAASFVVGTNSHYPTESSLIRDGLRKVLQLCVARAARKSAGGWRQHKHLYQKVQRVARQIDRIAARKGAGYQQRLQGLYRELLGLSRPLGTRIQPLHPVGRSRPQSSRAGQDPAGT